MLQLMDLTALRAVLSDLRPRLLPSRFEKAQQPAPNTLQIGFRSLRGMAWLELSWQADAPRLVQVPPPERQGAGSTLAQQFQHSLRLLALVDLYQDGYERVVEFRFASRPGEAIQRVVVLELMGRHSNVLLLDEQRRVIALGRQVRDHQSRIRPIATGDVYGPPPPLQGQPPQPEESFQRWRERLELIPVSLKKALQQTYQGMSPTLVEQLAGNLMTTPVNHIQTSEWEQLHLSWCLWLKCLAQESFCLQFEPNNRYRLWGTKQNESAGDLSLRLGRWYRQKLDQRSLEQVNEEVNQRLKRWRLKEETCLIDQQQRLQASANSSNLQEKADALLCLRKPSRDQVEQAQKLYHRARKLRRSVAVLQERIQHHEQRLRLIEGSEAFLEDLRMASWQDAAPRLSALQDLRHELEELLDQNQQTKGRRRKQAPTPQPLELIGPGGLVLQVGRNHRQNDWISLRQARNGDLWFHAQECPGSHVVLKASCGLADEEDLQLATDLAAHFSRARGNSHVPVVMVPIDQLQRIPGAGPGTVRHRGGEIRWGQPRRAEQQLADGQLLP